jgi:glycosyltransferase involved in cell wall biosynthesis
MTQPKITVVIPTIPPRKHLLTRAVTSVMEQTLPATQIIISADTQREGAAVTRQMGLDSVTTPLVTFLDDDDYCYQNHLSTLYEGMVEHDADFVFSYYDRTKGNDTLGTFGQTWSLENPYQSTIVTLVKTELAQRHGFMDLEGDKDLETLDRQVCGEDYRFLMRCANDGAKIVHIPKETWCWYRQGQNTSGLPRNVAW